MPQAKELRLTIAREPQCPKCGMVGFDDWWHDPTTKASSSPVCVRARLRCHGCGRFFSVTRYGDGETHNTQMVKQ